MSRPSPSSARKQSSRVRQQGAAGLERQGYTVIPINPNETEIEGHRAYATVLQVPGTIDMATVYVPPHKGVAIMDQLAAKGVPEVWLNPGADGDEVVARAHALGLKTIQSCSIVAIGESPGRYSSPGEVSVERS